MTTPFGPTQIATVDAHGACLNLPDGAQFQLDVLEPTLIRVRHRPAPRAPVAGQWCDCWLAGWALRPDPRPALLAKNSCGGCR